jgi:esterase/lipase
MKFSIPLHLKNEITGSWFFAHFLCFALLSHTSLADTIEVKLPSGIIASADFHQGLTSQPAILLLHGFLQTRSSPPMSTLANNLASKGYTTLSPTISLGINKRKQSMACEMVHTHTMNEEIAELIFWTKWLSIKGYKNIVLIGFSSTGNINILMQNMQATHTAVNKIILISINPMAVDQSEFKISQSPNSVRSKNNKKPYFYSLGYCHKNFFASNTSYLSYAKYADANLLSFISQNTLPTEYIFGSSDTVLPPNWPEKIRSLNTHAQITMIDKATHFFDGEFEFDLAEAVETSLANIPKIK